MKRSLRPAALAAVVSLVLAPALASAKTAAVPKAPVPALPGVSFAARPIHGVVLNAEGMDPAASVPDFPRLKADGVNLVSIYIPWQISTSHSSDVRRRADTPSDDELAQIATAAHGLGMGVEWMPLVMCAGGAPRYFIAPTNMGEWWSKFTAMTDHYASLAAANHIEVFSIGSEYGALQKYTSNWLTIIDHVRTIDHYTGLTTYMSTTGGSGFYDLGWWGHVDLLSVSPYYSLSTAKVPAVSEMFNEWRNNFLPKLQAQSALYHRPVLMDEIGYSNQDFAGYKPAVSFRNKHAHPNQQAQANAYQALLQASSMPQYSAWLKGVVWFYWGPAEPAVNDTGFSPRDKKAECVLADFWAARSTPQTQKLRAGQACFATHVA
jgi:hypothetical protein